MDVSDFLSVAAAGYSLSSKHEEYGRRLARVYWMSRYFSRYIPQQFFFRLVDLDVDVSFFSWFLQNNDLTAEKAKKRDVVSFLKKAVLFIDGQISEVTEWAEATQGLRLPTNHVGPQLSFFPKGVAERVESDPVQVS